MPALAATYSVDPVRVELSEGAPSQLVTLTNTADRELSFQVSCGAWELDDAGESRIVESSEVVCFPLLLTLAPGAERKLRVGVTALPGEREASYRLEIAELPPAQGERSGAELRVLTHVSIPVFLAPREVRRSLRLAGAGIAAGELRFRLVNDGSVHARPGGVIVSVRDAAGTELLAQQLAGWYVLAGGSRAYALALAPEVCRAASAVHLTVEGEPDVPAAVVPVGAPDCAAPAGGG